MLSIIRHLGRKAQPTSTFSMSDHVDLSYNDLIQGCRKYRIENEGRLGKMRIMLQTPLLLVLQTPLLSVSIGNVDIVAGQNDTSTCSTYSF